MTVDLKAMYQTGKTDQNFLIEPGDVVYVPPFTWHAPRWWGDGPSCRQAMNGYPYISHLFEADMGNH